MTEPHRAILARFVPLWPDELADISANGRRRLLEIVRAHLRKQRQNGLRGHWSYDLPAHTATYRAYLTESALLAQESKKTL